MSKAVAAWALLLASALLGACAQGGSEKPGARVTRVIDGDTVVMERLGRVRLIGAQAPEQGRCFENAATRFTRERLEGQMVRYEVGREPRDRYDRTLAYLSREGEMHNLALVSEGYARVLIIPPNDKYEDRFEQAERGRMPGSGRPATARRSEPGAPPFDGGRRWPRRGGWQRPRDAPLGGLGVLPARLGPRFDARVRPPGGRGGARVGSSSGGSGSPGGDGSSGGGSGRFACGPGDRDGDGDGRCNE